MKWNGGVGSGEGGRGVGDISLKARWGRLEAGLEVEGVKV